ncbi:hypothetical protein B0H14DRAFT_3462391 [Mycena olivaceomarginata]|nr:hypothetical protein B0H14DRAFT_3462391 [Mycena olivaceomarginata]
MSHVPSVVKGALHDSGERFAEPACHPGTRTAVLEQLKVWSVDRMPESTLLWLHGSAGVGRSAIAQKRGDPNHGTWHGLFTTLAYQLAKSVPELLRPIQQAVESDKLIDGRSMAVQFRCLLVEPFTHAPGLPSIPIMILDGLDECQDHKVQQNILRLFIEAIRTGELPIRMLFSSRPEPHIREILEAADTFAICRHSALSADAAAYEDIRLYLRDEFSRIHSEYTARGIALGAVWPTPEALGHLVKKSCGIFVYAATAIRFVDDQYSHPTDRLEAILSLEPESTAPLDEIVYTDPLGRATGDATTSNFTCHLARKLS